MKLYNSYKSQILKDERSKKLIFDIDGRNHYVYRITDNPGDNIIFESYSMSKYLKTLGPDVIGKTWNELGFSFVDV